MDLVSKTKEGRKWEEQFKLLTLRLYELKKVIKNAEDNFSLETCPECGNLKKKDKECPECYL